MDEEQGQKIATLLFNEGLPAFIITNKDSWINGYILQFDGMNLLVNDRKIGKVLVSVKDIRVIRQFIGDLSSLKKGDE